MTRAAKIHLGCLLSLAFAHCISPSIIFKHVGVQAASIETGEPAGASKGKKKKKKKKSKKKENELGPDGQKLKSGKKRNRALEENAERERQAQHELAAAECQAPLPGLLRSCRPVAC